MAVMKRREFIQYSAAAAILATVPAARAEPIGTVTITGPIPVVPKVDEPFRGTNEQPVKGPGLPPPVLIPFGYVEEEYFISGTVDGQPYKTSLLVRKPGNPAKFSGLIALETIHAQGAIPFWGSGHDVWMPGGHAWVAVTSQGPALALAKAANPARYGSHSLPAPAPAPAPAGAGAGPGRGGAGNRVSNAILTQVGALLKDNRADGPLKGLRVRYLLMGGDSQTGATTLNYIAQAHAAARRPDGKPIYDGYFPGMASPATPVPPTDAAIIHVLSENEVIGAAARPSSRRDDGDAPNDRYRLYELPGASHVVTRGVTDPVQIFSTLKGAIRPGEMLSQFPNTPFFTAFVVHLVNWVTHGTVPPRAGRIEVANGQVVRDEFGNAKGGIRSPYVDMPTAHYIARASMAGSVSDPAANGARGLIGLQEPIPQEKLRALYGTRAEYLRRFNGQIDKVLAARFILPAGARTLKAEEAAKPPF